MLRINGFAVIHDWEIAETFVRGFGAGGAECQQGRDGRGVAIRGGAVAGDCRMMSRRGCAGWRGGGGPGRERWC